MAPATATKPILFASQKSETQVTVTTGDGLRIDMTCQEDGSVKIACQPSDQGRHVDWRETVGTNANLTVFEVPNT